MELALLKDYENELKNINTIEEQNRDYWVNKIKRIEKVVYKKLETNRITKDRFIKYCRERDEILKEISCEMDISDFLTKRLELLKLKEKMPEIHSKALIQLISLLSALPE